MYGRADRAVLPEEGKRLATVALGHDVAHLLHAARVPGGETPIWIREVSLSWTGEELCADGDPLCTGPSVAGSESIDAFAVRRAYVKPEMREEILYFHGRLSKITDLSCFYERQRCNHGVFRESLSVVISA